MRRATAVLGVMSVMGVMSVAMALHAQSAPLPRATAGQGRLDPDRLQAATALLRQFVTERKIAGAVAAVAWGGRLEYLESVGVQDLESRTPMSDRSVFRIYSMTRPITAVAAMLLHEEKKFALTDPVAKYLPEFSAVTVRTPDGRRAPSRPMTVEDVLLHTAGINDRQTELYREENVRSRSDTLPQLMAHIVRVGLMEDPGARFRYGESTSVVGRLIEVWSGQPLDVFMAKRIFAPLQMTDTGFMVRPDQRARWTTVYGPAPDGGLVPSEVESVPFTEKPALLEGTVGLVSTVPDYLRFCQMLLNKGTLDGVRLLQPATVEQMTRNGLPAAILAERRGNVGWGLVNANVVLDPDSPVTGEYSWDGTAGTIFWIDPRRGMITLLFAPARPSNPDGLRQKFKSLILEAIINPA